jgi:colicin import membrane protein
VRPPAFPTVAAAFLASLALHAAVLAFALSGGASHGLPDGSKGLPVDILTEEQAARLMAEEPTKPVEPPVAAVRSDPEGTEPRDVEPARRPVRAPVPQLVVASASPEAVARADDAPGKNQPEGKPRRVDRKETARKALKGPKGRRKNEPTGKAGDDPSGPGSAPLVPAAGTAVAGNVRRTASLGGPGGGPSPFPPAMRDVLVSLLQQQIERCYVPPPGASRRVVLPIVGIRLRPNGSLDGDPRVVRSGRTAVDVALGQAALKAVRRCAPFRIPPPFAPYYEDWKSIAAEFEFPS